MKSLIVVFFVSFSVFISNCFAQAACDTEAKLVDFKKTVATADLWSNYRSKPGSIAHDSSEMLKSALIAFKKNISDCAKNAQIFFYSIPAKFLNDYSDKNYCEEFFKKTKESPIKYSALEFEDMDQFSSWFNEFSQGKGKQGKELYNKCDRSCSPQYKSIITEVASGIKADVEVICGPARDKDDNNYKLSVQYSFGN